MLPNEELKKFFSRVDSLVPHCKIKCKVEILTLRFLAECKRGYLLMSRKNCAKGRLARQKLSWDEVKTMVVKACADEDQMKIKPSADSGKRSHETRRGGKQSPLLTHTSVVIYNDLGR